MPRITLLKNATVIPLKGTMDSFTGGVFNAEDKFVEDSLLYRGNPGQFQETQNFLKGVYIYGGCLFGHFGHFIWETLSRLYAVKQCKQVPIIFISPNDKIYTMQKLILEALGINNCLHLVKEPTIIESLIYSPPGSAINPASIIDEQIDALAHISYANKSSKKKIWLSRSRLKSGLVTNEEQIQAELIKSGYEVIYTEELPIKEQVRLTSTAEIVAGFDGSQFFSCMLAKKIYGRFFIFNRRVKIAETIPYILTKRNVEFSLHQFNVKCVEGTTAKADSNYTHLESDKILDILTNI